VFCAFWVLFNVWLGVGGYRKGGVVMCLEWLDRGAWGGWHMCLVLVCEGEQGKGLYNI